MMASAAARAAAAALALRRTGLEHKPLLPRSLLLGPRARPGQSQISQVRSRPGHGHCQVRSRPGHGHSDQARSEWLQNSRRGFSRRGFDRSRRRKPQSTHGHNATNGREFRSHALRRRLWRAHVELARGQVSSFRTISVLTEGHDDEDDEEGVGHGKERVGQRREDLGDGGQLAEDAQHAAAAEQQDQAQRDADRGEADDGEGHNDQVKEAPAVGDERAPPVGEEVEEQLGREGDDQDKVECVEDSSFVL